MQREGEQNIADTRAAAPGARLSWRGVAQAAIGVGALTLVLMKTDARGLSEAIKSTRWAYLPFAVVAAFLVIWLMTYRWSAILEVRGHKVETRRLFLYYLIGAFFTNFVPGGSASGDVARLIYVDREIRDKAFVLSTLIYERLVGAFTLLLIGLVATLSSRAFDQYASTVYFAEVVLGLGLLAAATLMSNYVSSRLARLMRMVGARFKVGRVGEAAARTIEAISELRSNRKMLARTVAISVAVRIVWGLGCFAVARALDLPLGLPIVFAFISLVDLLRLMPLSVGGLGVREWLIIVLFAGVGISRERALTFSILAFAPIYLTAIVGGIVYVTTARIRRRDDRASEFELKRSEGLL
ncbi:MAG TPA: lysylphosphatidylglycerol synthase transmembrane domain-containing protein [Blastocatellia bacterium]|nr:lysylphosphatidylglycerol synthase transmembrane domain-containing protein [Blastocatellia bacterium]